MTIISAPFAFVTQQMVLLANMDGGTPNSEYLMSQTADGGGPPAVPTQDIDGGGP